MSVATGDAIWFDGMLMKVLVAASDTGGSVSVIEQVHRDGYSTPVHRHTREDQTLYVLDGAIRAWLGDEEIVLTAGQAVHLPREVPHVFRVEAEGTRLLEINTPGGFEEFHAAAGSPAAQLRLPDPAEPDIGAMVAAAADHGCEILGPPRTRD